MAVHHFLFIRDLAPRGLIRVSAPLGFGRKVVAPLIAAFRARHAEIAIELVLDEREADLVTGRVDVAFREGVLDDSQIIAKQLIPMQRLVCASPGYAQRHGLPPGTARPCPRHPRPPAPVR